MTAYTQNGLSKDKSFPAPSSPGFFYMPTIEKIREKVYRTTGIHHIQSKRYSEAVLLTKEDTTGVKKCVYRLWFGRRYIIWYGVTLWGSFYHFKRGYDNWDPGLNVFHQQMYQYMQANRNKDMWAELLFESENDYQILKFQQKELDRVFVYDKDDRCLNSEPWAYVPRWNNNTKRYGSFTGPAVRNYLRWIQSERYLKAKTGW
jgi:hypothetical protein